MKEEQSNMAVNLDWPLSIGLNARLPHLVSQWTQVQAFYIEWREEHYQRPKRLKTEPRRRVRALLVKPLADSFSQSAVGRLPLRYSLKRLHGVPCRRYAPCSDRRPGTCGTWPGDPPAPGVLTAR